MKFLSGSEPREFNILSLGQRGVGKTVFLAGSYLELRANPYSTSNQVWIECKDSQAQKNLEGIVNYVAQTGQYPPPTLKISNFDFALKGHGLQKTKTLCYLRWWDIPGEICRTDDGEFQQMILNSHSCCIFVNAYALVNDPSYLQKLEDMTRQAVAIASLVEQYCLDYAFALIFTQCDRLASGPLSKLQIEEHLQPLVRRLEAVKAKYRKFYLSIPIVNIQGTPQLEPTGAAEPLFWLLSHLQNRVNSNQDLGEALQTASTQPLKASSKNRRLILAGAGLLSILAVVGTGLWWQRFPQANSQQELRKYQQVLQVDPDNYDALFSLTRLYLERGQPDRAIDLMEKIVQQNPNNLELQFNLAQLYENTGQQTKAVLAYDRILEQQQNDVRALLGKAMLLSAQGDTETAKALFVRAEQAAPTGELKQKIRSLAQNSLVSPNNAEASTQ